MSRIGTFWSDAAQAPLVILSDFDFTISQVDVGDLIVETLAQPSEATLAQIRAGQAGSKAFWRDSMARAPMDRALALADTVALDPHFAPFAAWCRAEGLPLAVVSDGFWFYIRPIMDRHGLGDLPVFCNEMPSEGQLAFPHANPACDLCGCCKAGVARRLKEQGARLVYIGDGTSDLYASAFVDWVFAKGFLADYLTKQGTPFYRFDSFADVAAVLQPQVEAFRHGTAAKPTTLQPNSTCRF
jgi:2-hydroxy-3-keto-5-methylthiopentenyl-1-phosphate phosphatase